MKSAQGVLETLITGNESEPPWGTNRAIRDVQTETHHEGRREGKHLGFIWQLLGTDMTPT